MPKNCLSFVLLVLLVTNVTTIVAQEDEFAELDGLEDSSQMEEDEFVKETFRSTRLINGHTIETLPEKVLEFRVEHRFGDIAGSNGGIQNMFGFDSPSDIRLALEYGITDKLMVGFGRSKGAGTPYRSLVDGFVKYRFLSQQKGGSPVSIAVLGMATFSYMKALTDSSQVAAFPEISHRLAYVTQLNIARKLNNHFSVALMPTVVHQNYVAQDNTNTIFAMGGGARVGITSTVALLVEYYHCLTSNSIRAMNTNSLGVAVEFITFGHNFTLYFANSTGLGETQFITNTTSDWLKGQFRFGFAVGRKFEY